MPPHFFFAEMLTTNKGRWFVGEGEPVRRGGCFDTAVCVHILLLLVLYVYVHASLFVDESDSMRHDGHCNALIRVTFLLPACVICQYACVRECPH